MFQPPLNDPNFNPHLPKLIPPVIPGRLAALQQGLDAGAEAPEGLGVLRFRWNLPKQQLHLAVCRRNSPLFFAVYGFFCLTICLGVKINLEILNNPKQKGQNYIRKMVKAKQRPLTHKNFDPEGPADVSHWYTSTPALSSG